MAYRDEDDDTVNPENLKFPAGGDSLDEGPDQADMGPESVDLVRCPRCRKWVYEEAIRCPRCKTSLVPGEHLASKPRWYLLTTAIVLVLILLFWVLGGRIPGPF